MRVALLGGTGTVGRYAAESLLGDGHSVRSVSRRTGVDVYSGAGLDDALAGVDVVVDTLNTPSLRRRSAVDFFTTTAQRVQTAAAAQGVQHIVLLSILGIDRARAYPYYDAKLAQERAATAGTVPTTVLRATQFHEFPAQVLSRFRIGPLAVVPHIQSQPVAARTVGEHLAQLAMERPGGMVELAGPEVHDIADLARRLLDARSERLRVLAVTLPDKGSREMRNGTLLATPSTVIDGPRFEDWLRSDDARRLLLTRADDSSPLPPVSGSIR
jgi:uncharacterized protein YbjT (DUF2867 family)